MRFNFKRLSNLLFVSILCILSVSCSLLINGTGNIQFKLPPIEQSCIDDGIAVASANNSTDFNIILKNSQGRHIYNEVHEPNSVVYIDNIPIGKYEISLEAVTHTDIYSGKENVNVKSGKGTAVNIKLNKNPIFPNDGKKYGYFTGSVLEDNILDKASFEMYVRIYKQDGNRTHVFEKKINDSFDYITDELELGNYIFCIEGKDKKASYYQEMNISNMKEGKNELATIPLTRTGIFNIQLKFTKGPVPAEMLHIRILTSSGIEYLSTNIMSDSMCKFDKIPGGSYFLCIDSSNWKLDNYAITVDKDETFNIELQQKNIKAVADFYVGGEGASDNNSGAASAPYATLKKAISSNMWNGNKDVSMADAVNHFVLADPKYILDETTGKVIIKQ